MDKDHLRDLKILDEIDNGKEVTQRGLSEKLGIALGLTNACLKRLARKGYIKITNIKKNRIKYFITPKGIAEKTRLTYSYLQYTLDFYRDARSKIKSGFKDLVKKRIRRVIFYGAGEVAELSFLSLQEAGLELIGIIDDFKKGETFFGFPVLDKEKIKEFDFDMIIITSFRSMEAIYKKLKDLGIKESKIFKIG